MSTLFGIIFFFVAFGWGAYNYKHYVTGGMSRSKALFHGLTATVNLFVALLWFLRVENGIVGTHESPTDIAALPPNYEKVPDIPDVNVNITNEPIVLPVISPWNDAMPWIVAILGVSVIVAPEIFPFIVGAL